MKKLKKRFHIAFFILIPLVLLIGICYNDTDAIDINIHDTYFVVANSHFSLILAFLLTFSGLVYWSMCKLQYIPFKFLAYLHLFITYSSLISLYFGMFVIVNSKLPRSHIESNHPLFSDLIDLNILLTIAFLFFFIVQPILSVLQLLNLLLKKR